MGSDQRIGQEYVICREDDKQPVRLGLLVLTEVIRSGGLHGVVMLGDWFQDYGLKCFPWRHSGVQSRCSFTPWATSKDAQCDLTKTELVLMVFPFVF